MNLGVGYIACQSGFLSDSISPTPSEIQHLASGISCLILTLTTGVTIQAEGKKKETLKLRLDFCVYFWVETGTFLLILKGPVQLHQIALPEPQVQEQFFDNLPWAPVPVVCHA